MNLTTLLPSRHDLEAPRKIDWTDGAFALLLAAGVAYALQHVGGLMDVYEKAILAFAAVVALWMGWLWRPLRALMIAAAIAAGGAAALYQGDIARADHAFLLKYLLSSQSAVMWMSALFFLATLSYWIGLVARSGTAAWLGTSLTWGAAFAGLTGLLVRWRESYLISPDVGHIPVSNLYEVFILFALVTSLFYLYYERRYATRALGGFVLLAVSAAIGFLIWYTVARQGQRIEPLVPALQSWWMKLHVPANFIGYGSFALAAMVGCAYLVKDSNLPLADRLPALEVLDDLTYKSITIGFAFFTVATVLGALWAADAWGTYWQWDPKETWALIVWLNYAAWLHMRLIRGLHGKAAAWWALGGLVVTAFAFLGVNMFLSGLHSYGEL